jgi:peptidyl-prolyl cis-trans isomerase A (cyclophilin A)
MLRAAAILAALCAATASARADDEAEAKDAVQQLFLAIAGSEDGYIKQVLRPPVAYDALAFEDPKCAKQWTGKGKVSKGKVGKFARCVLSLVRKTTAGDLALTVGKPDKAGAIEVDAANSAIGYRLTLVRAKDGTLKIAALRKMAPVAGDATASATAKVAPPAAGDLAGYLAGIKDLPATGTLTATIATSLGDVHCELLESQAPRSVANFVGLATGQKPWTDPATGTVRTAAPFYDGVIFHRVIKGFMVQTGDPTGTGSGGPGYAFDDEIGVKNTAGTLAWANLGPNTNGSQFFINEVDNTHLDKLGFTVFGRCTDSDVVKAIAAVPVDAAKKPKSPVTITTVTITRR